MPDIIIRTSNPKTEGGNLDDVQISYKVEAVDADTGFVLYEDVLWLSSKGVGQDPKKAADQSKLDAAAWFDNNKDQISVGTVKQSEREAEIAVSKDILDAIASTPDVVATIESKVVGK